MNHLHHFRRLMALIVLTLSMGQVSAQNLTFLIHPVLSADDVPRYYEPLRKFVSKALGKPVDITVARNYLSHWHKLRNGVTADLVMDGPHITDWLHRTAGYDPIVKVVDVVSFTLVTSDELFVFEPKELTGQRIATIVSPSLGALTLHQLFPNPLRQPVIVTVDDSEAAVRALRERKAVGAIIPSPMVQAFDGLNTVTVLSQHPHVAISASPSVSAADRAKLIQALTSAADTVEGQELLQAINVNGYEAANASMYEGQVELLDGLMGR